LVLILEATVSVLLLIKPNAEQIASMTQNFSCNLAPRGIRSFNHTQSPARSSIERPPITSNLRPYLFIAAGAWPVRLPDFSAILR
jgi:hypothetical protein